MDSQPESSGSVLYFEFAATTAKPLTGVKPLSEILRQLEDRPGIAGHLAQARKDLEKMMDTEQNSLRALRLAAGLSQAKLADRAHTTQSNVARIEAGTLDPGTDMLTQLANAIGIPPVQVLNAIRAIRG